MAEGSRSAGHSTLSYSLSSAVDGGFWDTFGRSVQVKGSADAGNDQNP